MLVLEPTVLAGGPNLEIDGDLGNLGSTSSGDLRFFVFCFILFPQKDAERVGAGYFTIG